MSLFNSIVVNLVRERLRERGARLPLQEISRRHEQRLIVIGCVAVFFYVIWFLVSQQIARAMHGWSLEYYKYHKDTMDFPGNSPFGPNFWVFQGLGMLLALGAFAALAWATVQDAVKEQLAAIEHDDARQLAVVQEARQADLRAEQERRRPLEEAEKRRRAIFEFRFKALKHMEQGLLNVRDHYRERAEWTVESADEEYVFELIRKAIRSSRAPELGILRRSINIEVLMVLGDQQYLPPEPSDEELMDRHLPPVSELLGIRI